MKLYVLYKYYNYGTIHEKKEVMSVCTDMSVAHKLATKHKWVQETIEANKIRISGGCFKADSWKEDK